MAHYDTERFMKEWNKWAKPQLQLKEFNCLDIACLHHIYITHGKKHIMLMPNQSHDGNFHKIEF